VQAMLGWWRGGAAFRILDGIKEKFVALLIRRSDKMGELGGMRQELSSRMSNFAQLSSSTSMSALRPRSRRSAALALSAYPRLASQRCVSGRNTILTARITLGAQPSHRVKVSPHRP
jgi:hypothetical protein